MVLAMVSKRFPEDYVNVDMALLIFLDDEKTALYTE
jgi:hypothetical protein